MCKLIAVDLLSSLQALGIAQAILLSSVGPRQVPWEFVDSGAALPILIRFVRVSRTLGLHVSIPDAASHENTLLYEHLTEQPAGTAVIVVRGPTAAHDMHVADPGALVAAIAAATP